MTEPRRREAEAEAEDHWRGDPTPGPARLSNIVIQS
jgi:hypothetical protein